MTLQALQNAIRSNMTLHIDVTERTSKRRQRTSDCNILRVHTKVKHVVEGRVAARRIVIERNSTGNGVLSLG